MGKAGYVYIMSSRRNGTLYLGATSDLSKRVFEHREGLIPGFTKKYGCRMLVWFAAFDTIEAARARELQMKEWRRAWKIEAIETSNRDRADLFPSL